MTEMDNVTDRYIEACSKDFWQRIFEIELDYITEKLKGCRDILSVGCGPAAMEGELVSRGFAVAGMDMSREALSRAPECVTTILSRAEDMLVPGSSFDAVIFVASLQFMEDYRKAIERSVSVLREKGRILIMLLNPESEFIRNKYNDPDSYVSSLRHTDLKEIEAVVNRNFNVQSEYFLGVKGEEIFKSSDESEAVLYIINGTL